jgi:hypothetical protein
VTSPVTPPEPWDRLQELSDTEWKALAEATLTVIRGEAGDPPVVDPALPPGQLRKQLQAALSAEDIQVDDQAVDQIVTSDQAARGVALVLIAGLAEDAMLRDEIARVYQARRGMMVIDGGILTGPALLLLVMKLKRARVEKGKLDVEFYKACDGALDQVRKFFGLG